MAKASSSSSIPATVYFRAVTASAAWDIVSMAENEILPWVLTVLASSQTTPEARTITGDIDPVIKLAMNERLRVDE